MFLCIERERTESTMVKPRQKAVTSCAVDELLCFYRELFEFSGRNGRFTKYFRAIHPPCVTTMSTERCLTAQPGAQTRKRASSTTSATSKVSSRSRGAR